MTLLTLSALGTSSYNKISYKEKDDRSSVVFFSLPPEEGDGGRRAVCLAKSKGTPECCYGISVF